MKIIRHFITPPEQCAYLPDRMAEMEYCIAPEMSASEYEMLMNTGCRKFGMAFFRPVCADCNACRPIRVPLNEFKPSRAQRRNLKLNAGLKLKIADPICDAARMDLFHRYHRARHLARQWPPQYENTHGYQASFVDNNIPALEYTLWDGAALRGVLIAEITPQVSSAVYHYHDPALSALGLGTCLILHCMAHAREMNKRWVYLGYHVDGCDSMAYKLRFQPAEIMDEQGNWNRVAD